MTCFDFELTHCPVELSLDILNRKWVLQIICDMFFGKKRFSEFKEGRAELSNKALSRSLKFMEEQELIKKVVSDGNIEYFLTDKGKSLNKLIYDLVEYTLDNNGDLYNEETVIKAKEGFKRQLLD
ncbi:helix-turn-helix domain-containing protein [uncultured Methanobrevibacter sp.]|uniref:winged helix-turn-helix transcriptional regulator n=1 Tax=uncultured Methanobrevibacter sp. TaxID=253161 RepID=UPI0025EEB6BA|nr:helix-turn-helix domain-containing protein [uncultured Methanobrevibacter sp.]